LPENKRHEILNAIGCLAYFPDDRALAALDKASKSTDDAVRACGIEKLSYWHVLNDNKRRSVEELLSYIEDVSNMDTIDAVSARNALTVEGLLSGLRSENGELRRGYVWELGERYNSCSRKKEREVFFGPLVTALKDSASMVRLYAAEALKEVGDPRAIQPLLLALQATPLGSEYSYQRKTIALALVACGFSDESLVDGLSPASDAITRT
jgi:HEAT repeat protein